MRTFFRDEGGVGAIEFALIAPMLALVLLGIISGWSYYLQDSDMRDSVETAGKYYIQGGTNDATALSIAEAAWDDKPSDGTVALTRTCICAGAAASCSGVCGSGSVPEIHLTIVATSTWTNPFSFDSILPDGLTLNEREVIRVR
jgi:Flp pilus assembly protein TadG